ASTGRYLVKLWDVATGRLLLDLAGTNWVTDVAFSRDGRRLVASGTSAFYTPGRVDVWELQPDRGIQTLRGLASIVEKVAFSPDEKLLAALSHDSRVGVWDLHTGELLHVL